MTYNLQYVPLKHHKKLRDLKIGEILAESGDEEGDANMAFNLLTVASKGNAALLDELLKAKLDPDIGDSKGRTPLVCLSSLKYLVCLLMPDENKEKKTEQEEQYGEDNSLFTLESELVLHHFF